MQKVVRTVAGSEIAELDEATDLSTLKLAKLALLIKPRRKPADRKEALTGDLRQKIFPGARQQRQRGRLPTALEESFRIKGF